MARAWWDWDCHDNYLYVYKFISGDNIYVFDNRLRDSHVWISINVDAGDDVSFKSDASEMVFSRLCSCEHVTTNFSSDGDTASRHINGDGSKSVCASRWFVGPGNSQLGSDCRI